MPTCPKCRKRDPDEATTTCADDGEALLPDAAFTGVDPDLASGQTVGEYRVEKKIGEGGIRRRLQSGAPADQRQCRSGQSFESSVFVESANGFAFHLGSARRESDSSSQHHRHLRLRIAGGWSPIFRDGAARGDAARRVLERKGATRAGGGDPDFAIDRARHRRRARRRNRASRSETGKCVSHVRRGSTMLRSFFDFGIAKLLDSNSYFG